MEFADHTDARYRLPVIDPTRCSGCGDCWVACPHGTLTPVALTPRSLLDGLTEHARLAGHSVDALTPVASRVASRIVKEVFSLGACVNDLAPEIVITAMRKKFGNQDS